MYDETRKVLIGDIDHYRQKAEFYKSFTCSKRRTSPENLQTTSNWH